MCAWRGRSNAYLRTQLSQLCPSMLSHSFALICKTVRNALSRLWPHLGQRDRYMYHSTTLALALDDRCARAFLPD